MRNQNRLHIRVGVQRIAYGVGVGGAAEWEIQAYDLCAKAFRDFAKAHAEHAYAHIDDLVAGGQRIDDGGFHCAGAGRRQDVEVACGVENLLDPLGGTIEKLFVLGAAVIDHLPSHRL